MAWMSINEFKRRHGFGNPYGEEKVTYEEFHSVKNKGTQLFFEAKKRYVRMATTPLDCVFPLSADQAAGIIEALEKKIEIAVPDKWHYKKIKKDSLGFKVYGQFNDAQDIAVVVREVDSGHAAILWVNMGFPHMRVQEVRELVLALSRFVHEQRQEGKPCKLCVG